jgi:hypothetical protein
VKTHPVVSASSSSAADVGKERAHATLQSASIGVLIATRTEKQKSCCDLI